MAYNIPVSVSASTSSGVNSPFADDTYILFTGSTYSAYQPVSNNPSQATTATASAAEGNASAASQTAAGSAPIAGQTSAPLVAAATGFTTMDYILAGGFLLMAVLLVKAHL